MNILAVMLLAFILMVVASIYGLIALLIYKIGEKIVNWYNHREYLKISGFSNKKA